MKVLYIHQYFNTPEQPGGTRSYWITKELINRGHQAVMITSTRLPNVETGRKNVDGIEVIYLQNSYSNYMSKTQKVRSFLRFMSLAVSIGKKEKDVDIVYATSTPLTVGYVALRLKAIRKWRYIFEVRDLWPEFPIQIGAIRNPLVISFLRFIEKQIYKKAEHVVALSPGMKEGVVSTGIPETKVSMIPNMSKPEEFYPRKKSMYYAEKFSIDVEKFNIIHFGSMGRANGLQYIVETAKLFQEHEEKTVNFIFVGDGATRPILKELAIRYQLTNVQFVEPQKMDVLSEIVNLCDVSVVSFVNLPILYTNSPNKLFDSLSAGKPVVVNSAGWTKDLVEKNNCGFYVDPQKPEDFFEKVMRCKDNYNLLDEWGRNARRLSLEVFDRTLLAKQVADLIEEYGKH